MTPSEEMELDKALLRAKISLIRAKASYWQALADEVRGATYNGK
jgi:hypothetical protein